MNSLLPELRLLAARLQELEQEAEKAGLFVGHRPLLECAACGLLEDVAFNGLLMTYFASSGYATDTGLRFEKVSGGFLCPSCRALVAIPTEEEEW